MTYFVARLVEPSFRKILIHEPVALDLHRVIAALNELEPIEQIAEVVGANRGVLLSPTTATNPCSGPR